MRGNGECHLVTKKYLDALFSPLNMARGVAEPMVIPASALPSEHVEEWREISGELIDTTSPSTKTDFALITLHAMWTQVGSDVRQVHTWRSRGKIISAEEKVAMKIYYNFMIL
tara:strand:+ start:493 stop:831 length:339 start_codon:yes stop_codon:yes gene_type:complete